MDGFDADRLDEREGLLSVGQLTARIKQTLEGTFPSVWVVGEVTDLARPRSGHIYLTLKDASAQIRAVLWRTVASAPAVRLGGRPGGDLPGERGGLRAAWQLPVGDSSHRAAWDRGAAIGAATAAGPIGGGRAVRPRANGRFPAFRGGLRS